MCREAWSAVLLSTPERGTGVTSDPIDPSAPARTQQAGRVMIIALLVGALAAAGAYLVLARDTVRVVIGMLLLCHALALLLFGAAVIGAVTLIVVKLTATLMATAILFRHQSAQRRRAHR